MPRYDLPKAAPGPLREVQLLINSCDVHGGAEWLPDWLSEHGLGAEELERARELREALRALVLENNGFPPDERAHAVLDRAIARVALRVGPRGTLRVEGGDDALDVVVRAAVGAMLDGSWRRLKACRNCAWSFHDYSPNRSAAWCSMQICGNRTKTRAYRRRRRADDA